MTWLNGRKPDFMQNAEPVKLTARQALKAAKALSYDGARIAAMCFIMLANRQGLSPAYISEMLEECGDFPVKIKGDSK